MNTLPEWAAHLVSHVRLAEADSRAVQFVSEQLEEYAKQATAELASEVNRWRIAAQARSRGNHDRMEGKPKDANPYPQVDEESQTCERAWWFMAWQDTNDSLTLAAVEKERDALRGEIARLRDALATLERTLGKLSVRAANAGCSQGFVGELAECAEAARLSRQEGHNG